ncbi:Alpha/Beta hydrolase protein [Lactarius pseudohatsudake]|nr:Alpha/Beta hydrolase protein [Lactarius pseudohatsudake]
MPNTLHPSIIPRLDPEYAAFHNEHIIHLPQAHELPWDPAIRNMPHVPGSSAPLPVGRVEDHHLSRCKVRVFTPEGPRPQRGWPVFIFFHGGGWTLGNINSENAFCTNMCKGAECVVVSKPVEDAIEALQWVWVQGASTLGIDTKRIAVGGSSSGGNLAAVLTHKAAQLYPPIPLTFQLLIVPVTDNTASASGVPHASWRENRHTPWLSPARMLSTRARWDASPLLAQDEMFRRVPRAWIAVTELDILRDEGISYGKKLLRAGVPAEIKTYRAAPHPIMAMDAAALAQAFGTA